MTFIVVWADGSENTYRDERHFDTEGAVLKIGYTRGRWSWYFAPHQWAHIEHEPRGAMPPPFPRVVAGLRSHPGDLGSKRAASEESGGAPINYADADFGEAVHRPQEATEAGAGAE
jgi:hypothetical protein